MLLSQNTIEQWPSAGRLFLFAATRNYIIHFRWQFDRRILPYWFTHDRFTFALLFAGGCKRTFHIDLACPSLRGHCYGLEKAALQEANIFDGIRKRRKDPMKPISYPTIQTFHTSRCHFYSAKSFNHLYYKMRLDILIKTAINLKWFQHIAVHSWVSYQAIALYINHFLLNF